MIQRLKKLIQKYKNVRIIKTFLINDFRSSDFLVYKKAQIFVEKSAKIRFTSKAELKFGIAWENTAYKISSLKAGKNAELIVKGKFRMYTGAFISINDNAKLEIDSGYINNNSEIVCFESIKIGKDVAISKGVIIRDSDNHTLNNSLKTQPIEIGDHVWIGMGAMILKGVKIGSGAVIAAGSIVNRDVLPNTLVGGVPAKTIKTNVVWK